MSVCVLLVSACRGEESLVKPGKLLTSDEGAVSFVMELDRSYGGGAGVKTVQMPLLKLPGLAEVQFRTQPQDASIWWIWDTREPFYHILQGLPEWEPGRYFIQYSWSREKAKVCLYINGVPTRELNAHFSKPWNFHDQATEFVIEDGPIKISDVKIGYAYRPWEDLKKDCPADLMGRYEEKLWDFPEVKPMDLSTLKLVPVYSNALASADAINGWVLEGAGDVSATNGWLTMWSLKPDAVPPDNGHIVYWCPQDFPENFVAEWETQILSPEGLLIVFFATQGLNGEDIFDPALPKRNGTFGQYINAKLHGYHISYFSNPAHEPGRTTSNLRKNPPSFMVTQGPVGIPATSKAVHQLRLIKNGAHIQMQCDGRVIIDYTDDQTDRYGAPYGGGKIGFRQMQWTQARYRNFRVSEFVVR